MVQITDVFSDPDYRPYREIAAEAGYRAVQSTPLVGRSGEVAGVLSVHFRDPHSFSERDRQLGDLLGHEAAKLILSRVQQDQIEQANANLRARTEELAASRDQLSKHAADLVEQDRHREGFLAALGHELRNPLSAIMSSAAVLSASDDRSRRALAVLRRQVGT
jgi:signal transduction histidine kinase